MTNNEIVKTVGKGLTADKIVNRMGEWRSDYNTPVLSTTYQDKVHEYTTDEEKAKYMQ